MVSYHAIRIFETLKHSIKLSPTGCCILFTCLIALPFPRHLPTNNFFFLSNVFRTFSSHFSSLSSLSPLPRSLINNKKPLWLRPPRDCTEAEYSDFYKQTFNAYDEPAAHAHFSVEGNVDFKVSFFFYFFHLLHSSA